MAIFTAPELSVSKLYDTDKDGLTKEKEIVSGTNLDSSDTDNDGYNDGERGEERLFSANGRNEAQNQRSDLGYQWYENIFP